MNFQEFLDSLKGLIERASVRRVIKEVDSWDGAASNYSDTDAYCAACLIDVNEAAGNEEKTQALCKLPIREEGDASNVYVDKAVFAAAGGRGIGRLTRPADVPETSWNAAVRQAANKLIDAYDQMERVAPAAVWDAAGKEPPEEARALSTGYLYEQLDALVRATNPQGYPWIHDIFHSEQGMSVVWSDGGLLYSAPVNVDGDDVASLGVVTQVKQEFVPVGRTVVREQPDGRWRWFTRSAVSVLNRVGEIDSTALFDSFIEHAEATGEYPTRQFFHQMGSAFTTGQTDWLGREGNVLLSSGLYNDSELAQVEIKARQANPDHWGDSIHFEPVGDDALELLEVADGVIVPVYRSGRLIEISTLPEQRAASWFTSGIVQEDSMNPKEFEGLIELFGGDEEKARQWLETNAGELNRQIQEAGMVARSAVQEGQVLETDPAPLVIDDEVIAQVARVAVESEAFVAQGEAVQALTGELAAINGRFDELAQLIHAQQATLDLLTQADDEKRQRYQEDMPARRTQVVYRPSVAHRAQDGENGNQQQLTSTEAVSAILAKKGIRE